MGSTSPLMAGSVVGSRIERVRSGVEALVDRHGGGLVHEDLPVTEGHGVGLERLVDGSGALDHSTVVVELATVAVAGDARRGDDADVLARLLLVHVAELVRAERGEGVEALGVAPDQDLGARDEVEAIRREIRGHAHGDTLRGVLARPAGAGAGGRARRRARRARAGDAGRAPARAARAPAAALAAAARGARGRRGAATGGESGSSGGGAEYVKKATTIIHEESSCAKVHVV